VLLDALVDYGGTLIFVSHDRYFVERLATRIIEVGNGTALVYPGTYKEFLWHKEHPQETPRQDRRDGQEKQVGKAKAAPPAAKSQPTKPRIDHTEKKRQDAEARKEQKAVQARQA